ncbi:uncharacterized protein LOC108595774 isoform X2 [Drosophila busckii]|uniref:uncharacterized protein LOC108595774 isoform X2 n=1 Tax=Drosophila busckii TaxID=30019 RepID=UPI00083EDF17|nr:uncharacterized protein LOC108595774 isoform X2 [Drosophila busckii]
MPKDVASNKLQRHKNLTTEASALYVSGIKITVDGYIRTKHVSNVRDRHLHAQLQLPALQERCALASNTNLLELSKKLEQTPKPAQSAVEWHQTATEPAASQTTVAIHERQKLENYRKQRRKKRDSDTTSIAESLAEVAPPMCCQELPSTSDCPKPRKRSVLKKLKHKLAEHHLLTLLLLLANAIYIFYILTFDISAHHHAKQPELSSKRLLQHLLAIGKQLLY